MAQEPQAPTVAPASSQPPKKSNTTMIIIIVVVVLLLCCCCLLALGIYLINAGYFDNLSLFNPGVSFPLFV
jgi:hypothetical protein